MWRASALGALVATVVLATPAGAASPKLHVTSVAPRVVVSGFGFQPREHVRLSVIGRTVSTVSFTASATGTFGESLRRPTAFPCGRLLLRATGSSGSVATLRLGPASCPPVRD